MQAKSVMALLNLKNVLSTRKWEKEQDPLTKIFLETEKLINYNTITKVRLNSE
jgi:hypothetical protein